MARVALILGSANCVWRDVDAACEIGEFHGVVAAKRAGVLWPHDLDAWVSLHPDQWRRDIAERERLGFSPAPLLFQHEASADTAGAKQVPYKFKGQRRSGSSGLFAARVALEVLGFDRGVLCGIPLDLREGKLDKGPVWPGASSFRQGFIEALPRINHRLRSMSGWTMQTLGRPTAEWIGGV